MIFSQLAHLPIIFQVDEGISISESLHKNNISFHNILLVSGGSYSKEIASNINRSEGWDHLIIHDNTGEQVNEIRRVIEEHNYRLIIAVGGGKVLDTVKRAALLHNVNHLAVPTIISNDGLISPIAVIKNMDGQTESLPGQMPTGVFIDLNIIQNSPERYLQAAAGDILSNLSATNDWILAGKNTNAAINDIAFQMSRSAAHSLVYFKTIDFRYKPFLKQIIQGQVSSGIAMSLAGTSRPCSGSEHLISHAIDHLNISQKTLHGLQVASISLFSLYLQDKLKSEHLDYAHATRIPVIFTELHDGIELQLPTLFELSKEMRPGRYTVLDQFTKKRFLEAFQQFKKEMTSVKT